LGVSSSPARSQSECLRLAAKRASPARSLLRQRDMGSLRGGDALRALVAEPAKIDIREDRFSVAEIHRRDGQVHLVH
jgi:hypothetical protein